MIFDTLLKPAVNNFREDRLLNLQSLLAQRSWAHALADQYNAAGLAKCQPHWGWNPKVQSFVSQPTLLSILTLLIPSIPAIHSWGNQIAFFGVSSEVCSALASVCRLVLRPCLTLTRLSDQYDTATTVKRQFYPWKIWRWTWRWSLPYPLWYSNSYLIRKRRTFELCHVVPMIKGSWEAILPCYGQIDLWDLTLMKGDVWLYTT